MRNRRTRLDLVASASLCPHSWSTMTGDDRARRCAGCGLAVVNPRGLSEDQALELLRDLDAESAGGTVYRRADGTVLSRNCPIGAAGVRRRLLLLISVYAVVFLLLGILIDRAGGGAFTYRPQLWFIEPFRSVVMRLDDYFRPPPTMNIFESRPASELPPTP